MTLLNHDNSIVGHFVMRHVLIGEKSEIICSSGSSGTLQVPSAYITYSTQSQTHMVWYSRV